MNLRALRLWNVRRFAGRGVALEDIGDGVNVLSAANEQGKSTCFDALHALFFQPHTGTPAPVRLLRPYSGGSPRIEADIETPDGRYRVAKQYYSGKQASVTDIASGRLIAQADEAEAWIAELVRGGASGPAGLLWVRQGTIDIGTGTPKEREEERKARQDVLTSVAGEVEALTGGRRMVRIMERCKADLEKLITTKGPKTGGPYQLAIQQRDELKEEEQALKHKIDSLREALDERRTKRAHLEELNDADAVAARRAEKEQTAKALEEANKHAEKLRAAEAAAQLAATQHETAAQALAQYDESLARAATLAEDLAAKEQALAEAKQTREKAAETDATAAGALEKMESKVEAARTHLAQAQAAQRAAEASRQLSELKERLEKAEATRRSVEQLKAEAESLALPGEVMERLETLEREIAVMRASAKAAAVTVAIHYAAGKEGRILRDGTPLPDGEEQSVTATTRLDIAEIGVLTVSPGASGTEERPDASLEEAEAERRRLLAEAGVESVAAARERHRAATEKDTALREAEAQLDALAPKGLEALRAGVAQSQTQADEVRSDAPDPEQAQETLDRMLEGLREARTAREVARERLNSVNGAFIQAESAVTAMREELARTEETLGPQDGREAEHERLASEAAEAERRLQEANKAVEALREEAPDLEAVEAAAKRTATAFERAEADVARLEKEISELTGRITTHANDAVEEAHEEVTGQLEAAEARVAAFEAEVAALSRLNSALEEARSAAKEQYFGPVVQELKPLLSMLLDEASVTFDEETLLPQYLERDGQDENVEVLSGGMREQLAILTRLAFARLLARGGQSVPVILDDALVYCDDDRIERMFNALHRQARDLQILVFSCRQRAFERLGGQSLSLEEWQA